MNKLSKVALSVIAITSINSQAYQISNNIDAGIYGDSTYSRYDTSEVEDLKANGNAYIKLKLQEEFVMMLDYRYQYEKWTDPNQAEFEDGLDLSSGEFYQGYLGYDSKGFGLKAGRFADFHVKGENALNQGNAMVHNSISPFLIHGQSSISTIDGVAFDYKTPLYGGKLVTTIYGGLQEEQYSHDFEMAKNIEVSSKKYGLHLDANKLNHRFIFGMEFSDIDEVLAEGLTENDRFDLNEGDNYKSVYFTYQFENEVLFSDNSYLLSEIEAGDESYYEDVLDLKIGTNFNNIKPFIGYNITSYDARDGKNHEYQTISYGMRYDYQNMLGFVVKRDNVEKISGGDVEDHRWTANVFFNF